MNPRLPRFPTQLFVAFACVVLPLHADWKDDIGYTRLTQTFTTGVPTSVAAGVTQAEAADTNGNYYLPDFTNGEFTGKTLTNMSTGSGGSGHATTVGAYFYGNSSSILPATTQIDAYTASNWIGTGFLNYGTVNYPLTETRRVQNHSWIGSLSGDDASISNLNKRLDYAINRDGVVTVVGVNNGTSTTLPDLLCQGYHTISVGLVNGQHSAGLTAYDTAGRMKPDLVAFESVTSFSTPQVASAGGLISEKLRNTTYSPALTTADYPRITKALLLAGAAKEPLTSWSRADTAKPYDTVYGAGALNVLLSYRILAAGKQAASSSAAVAETGWDVNSVKTTTTKYYFFDVPTGTASARFSAALTWHRAITTSPNFWFNVSATLANLDLKLFNATDTTVGTQLDASVSTVDNVEHIYEATLAPGRYALQVSSASTTTTSYALAWRTSPTVTVTATTPVARELDGTAGVFTLTRTGPTTSPLFVPLLWSGTATAGSHYATPASAVLIPAGASTATVQITPIADTLAQGDRTVVLAVATDYSLSAGSPANATVTIQDKPYDSWRFTRFTTAELADSTISGDSADPDADGQPNLLEYALDAEPKTADNTTHAPTVAVVADRLTLTYTRPTSSTSDLTYAVEWSGDLQTWSTGANVTETVSTTDNGNGTTTVVVRSITTVSTTPRQFLRLRVTRL